MQVLKYYILYIEKWQKVLHYWLDKGNVIVWGFATGLQLYQFKSRSLQYKNVTLPLYETLTRPLYFSTVLSTQWNYITWKDGILHQMRSQTVTDQQPYDQPLGKTDRSCSNYKFALAWGLLNQFSMIYHVTVISRTIHTLIAYWISRSHLVLSPKLSCGDPRKIWMWFTEYKDSKNWFFKIENVPNGDINERNGPTLVQVTMLVVTKVVY